MKAGWDTGTLVSVSTNFTDGDWIETKDQSESGIRLVQTGNVGVGDFKDRRDKARFISEATFERLKCFEVLPDDCLISRLPDPVGRGCLIPDTGDKMITAVDCSVVRIDQSQMLPSFYLYYLQSAEYFALVEADCTGTTRKRISRKKLEAIPIPIPPLEEQKRIVAVLDAAFEGLTRAKENAETNLQNARELFERGLASLLSGLQDEVRCELGSVATFHNGDRGKNYPNKVDYVATGVPWMNTGHIMSDGSLSADKMNFITQEKFETLRGGSIQAGDLVFCLRGATIGKTAFVYPYEVGAVASSLMIIRPTDDLHSRFAYYFLTSDLGKAEIDRFIGGAAQPNLAGKSVGKFNMPLPSIEVQESVCDQLELLRRQSDNLKAQYTVKLTDIADLRQSLLQKAFAGELT